MHEFTIVQGLIQQIEEYLKRENYKKVLKINLEIGDLSGVVKEALEFAYDVCSKGTSIEGAQLKISRVPVKARCDKCYNEFFVEDYCFLCPDCGGIDLKILSGRELKIKEMEVDDGD